MSRLSAILLGLILCFGAISTQIPEAAAQTRSIREFQTMLDTLDARIKRRTTVDSKLRIRSARQNDDKLSFTFTESLSDIPWRKNDITWLRNQIKENLPASYKNCTVGDLMVSGLHIEDIAMYAVNNDGKPHDNAFRVTDRKGAVLVKQEGARTFSKGLSGRHIAVWQSHGRYYEETTERWEWQRAQNFMTVEDMYTQTFVVPFLIPMLENAGAVVMTPRERDPQTREIVADNDPAFEGTRDALIRQKGTYSESGTWTDAGQGFADAKRMYVRSENPFKMGTARQAKCDQEGEAQARWTASFPQRGSYAVYVSYKTLSNSASAARYTVKHLGGETTFLVNQRMGGGTWIYLGTFEFEGEGSVVLSNKGEAGTVVTADGVRFGGGMGKIARGPSDRPDTEWTVSGVPAYMEGALYSMQWAGVDSTILTKHPDDYTNDFADRGPWVGWLAGGSRSNPKEPGKNIPFDLTFAFHSDAGVTPNDSIVGTLAIYTLLADGKQTLPDGEDRLSGRQFADYVQTQVVNDIRADFEPEWTRRNIWNRSYSESRTPPTPAMILELLAHQNFADMKYGHDPAFRFTVSRAVYKGMLKFLADRYGVNYAVQPLPVQQFSATLTPTGDVQLRWKPTPDPKEPTAMPTGYILQTRIDDGVFNEGVQLADARTENGYVSTEIILEPGKRYSFRIIAYNDGGKSFPSEVLSAAVPQSYDASRTVMVVNNFTRVSGPTWFDTPTHAGFDLQLDGGVPAGKDIGYIGEQYQFRRELPWLDDDNPGFGGSYSTEAGRQTAGNTFDYPAVHGKALLAAGYAYGSMGVDAFIAADSLSCWAVDLICGKQVSVPSGRPGAMPDRYQVFPQPLQDALTRFTSHGGNVLASGAHIGSDLWDQVYPTMDATYQSGARLFAQRVLGYKWLTNYASRTGEVWNMKSARMDVSGIPPMTFRHFPNEVSYHVETPDGLLPASEQGSTILRYRDTNISAGICFQGANWRTVVLGFPIETLTSDDAIRNIISASLDYFAAPAQ